jgi:uncharacterized membrane protein YkoI
MSILRVIAVAAMLTALAFAPNQGITQTAEARAPCGREEAIRVALRACPGTPTGAVLGQGERWIVNITETNDSKWEVQVNSRTCRVVPMSMKKLSR